MEGGSPIEVSKPAGAVFLSYASEDADAAKRICEALRAAGIEVWFDQSELRAGDAWDRQIRSQIKSCAQGAPLSGDPACVEISGLRAPAATGRPLPGNLKNTVQRAVVT